MKTPPQYVSQLLALVLGGIGAAFVLMGALFTWMNLPVQGGGGWSFSALGLVLLVGAGLCLVWYGRRKALCRRLLERGVKVEHVGCSIEKWVWINWNTRSFTNIPGQNSPWVVRCSYRWEDKLHTVTSPLVWNQPAPVQYPVIYVDPKHPRRACIDVDTLSFLVF